MSTHIQENFPAYWEDNSNLSLAFTFEELVSYTDTDVIKMGKIQERGARWDSKVIKAVRVLVPSPFLSPQIYIARNGNAIHGQHTLKEIIQDLMTRKQFPPHIFIWNNDNYSDNFMLVINKFPSEPKNPIARFVKNTGVCS